jgi:hypothetical protein
MLVCPTRDISEQGCFLDTDEKLAEGEPLEIAVMDHTRGEAVEVRGQVRRRLESGVGVIIPEPPEAWSVLVERFHQMSGPIDTRSVRLRVLVVGDNDHRRGALALYVTSGWDVRFASDLEGAVEALHSRKLSAVIAEHELDDSRWPEILSATRRIQPDAKRIVRAKLHGRPAPESAGSLVHRVVDAEAGLDALLDALTADFGPNSSEETHSR